MKYHLHDIVKVQQNAEPNEYDIETLETYNEFVGKVGEIVEVDYSGLPYPYVVRIDKYNGLFLEDELELVKAAE